ncbi:hypothetical protein ANN_06061 [Periplaneta americana]|uniref:Alpha-amylase n=1 Tax=Periplaneta americana TaxID=6978 RepID=A0ABQ8TCH9_PERAM|nr:hypothetical protein ANN_06061 [Periplaneta americana]
MAKSHLRRQLAMPSCAMRLSVASFLLIVVEIVSAHKDPHTAEGRSAIVHLFEWKFDDIAAECERFLAPHGYAGVQVSPVHENLLVLSPNRPWWERYQLISYNITSRSGDEAQFRSMVRRCNDVKVRIYVDVVLNHMSGNHPNASGVAGSIAYPVNLSYPAIPYGPQDFHTPCGINNYNDPGNVRNCELAGLHDLKQGTDYVREKLVQLLDELVDAGVAGFRIDAAKHMWPSDLEYVYNQVNNLNTEHGFANDSRPFFYQEVIDMGDGGVRATEYTPFGRVTEFKYGAELGRAFRGNNAVKWLSGFGPQWGFVPDGDAVVFVDNHDTQRAHRAGGSQILTHKDPKLYKSRREDLGKAYARYHLCRKDFSVPEIYVMRNVIAVFQQMAVAFMLAYPYGYPRIMSSYYFTYSDEGPPQDGNGTIISPSLNSDDTCGNGWVCEHRWRQIYNMVDFRNVVTGERYSFVICFRILHPKFACRLEAQDNLKITR